MYRMEPMICRGNNLGVTGVIMGTLVILEGGDGSSKATQTKLLVEPA